ncbi:MAG: DNA-deoxyinosine glycosylase [Caulobacteraceae bacterium]
MGRKRSFAPVVDAETRLLILGSLPGEASLAAAQYYANPRNAFWRLMERVLDEPLLPLAYEARLAALLRRRVGLWDVIGAAEREGSLDAAIRNATHNDLAELVERLPALRAVAFNGAASAKVGRSMLEHAGVIELIGLPSSSPAYAALPLEGKAQAWIALRPYITTDD